MTITGSHDTALVALSILLATVAAYTALDLAGRVRASAGWTSYAWLATAAAAMGGGIWSMHFVAMLAFSMPGMEVHYDLGLTVLSLVLPILVTGGGFYAASRASAGLATLGLSGLIMGLGIVGMHYLGMAAMRMPADLGYDSLWVAVSVLIAIGASTIALWLAFRHTALSQKLFAAIAMGVAVSGMHYAAMQAAVFTAHASVDAAHGYASIGQTNLALAVAATTFAILFFALVAAMFDRRFAVLAEREAMALRRSGEQFRSLYRKTPLPLHALDAEGSIEEVSDAWLDLLGYRREEVVGRPLINFMTEESARRRVQADWPKLLAEGVLREADYRLMTRNGVALDVLMSAGVERDADGGFLRALGGVVDVTARKRAEEALRQAQKTEAIGQLTGGVAHDFNNLLAVILGNLELLRKRVPDDPKIIRMIENAVHGAERGAALTQRMLSFARRQDLKPEPVCLPDLVRGMEDLLQRSIGPQVRIETRFPLGLAYAFADANQLELALLNLSLNARDAMRGGGVITIAAEEQMVGTGQVRGLAPGRYVCLSVSDTGEGMDEQTLARAMEPFFTTKGVGKGTGLGLSMVQGLAEQSGGALTLRSRAGEGTAAEVWLPVAKPETKSSQEEAARVAKDQAAFPALAVLAVDDDALVLMNTAAMLEDLGHTVVEASSGQEALAILRSGRAVDVVITDQAMPGMTGLQLADAVKAEWPTMPVLLVTGYAELPPEADGAPARLPKPFRQDTLAEALAACVKPAAGSGQVLTFRQRPG